jgi:inner membrane protein involved in colicin E2 resistance
LKKRWKRKIVIAPRCDYCGQTSETFVVNGEGKTFCMVYKMIGIPPIKDCMSDYIRSENVRKIKKEEEQRRLQSNCKEQLQEKQEEKKEVRLKNIQKLEAYRKELKLKQWQKRNQL